MSDYTENDPEMEARRRALVERGCRVELRQDEVAVFLAGEEHDGEPVVARHADHGGPITARRAAYSMAEAVLAAYGCRECP